jgi:hypothetical protein
MTQAVKKLEPIIEKYSEAINLEIKDLETLLFDLVKESEDTKAQQKDHEK